MEPSARTRIQELLRVASRLPAAARASFLERAEPRDARLREEVLSLLAFDAGQGELAIPSLGEPSEVGPYRLRARLGEAPPARLFRACRRDDADRSVLVALAGPGPAAAQVAEALGEQARRQRGLQGPAFARLLEAFATEERRLVIAFEPVEGVPLAELCDALRLGIEARVALIEQVAEIVESAHARGIAPLGLLPWSVLGTWRVDQPQAALIAIDPWPLLALLEPERRAQAELLAGLETSPPEALRGEPRGVAADVFGLGALLFEAVTGTPPLGLRRLAGQRTLREELRLASSITAPLASERVAGYGRDAEVLAALRSTRVRELVQALSPELDDLLARALASDPSRRPASAGQLAGELAAWRLRRARGQGLRGLARRLARARGASRRRAPEGPGPSKPPRPACGR